ncbi:enoyl-CoA delta isomerase 1, mitochondrial [Narcine bancroftii]|uniref:enoyl-CoA delta isomerase 1, mitochondrial n=1 Tax=Narcine bancroftii TaxID=1343680 RepID=UPI0038322568
MATLWKVVPALSSGYTSLYGIKNVQYKAGRILCQLPFKSSNQKRLFTNKNMIVELDNNTGVAVIKMKKPPVNSLSLEFLTEFAINIEKLEMDRECRGVILTSSIPSIFSAGLDINEMYGKPPEHTEEFWRAVQEMWLKLYGSNLVTIAAINGASPAGGCLIAMACDYRIMADNPKYGIGLNETKLGIVAPFWFKDTMINTIGKRATEHSLQLGLLYSAPEALKIGLVDHLVPQDKVMAIALNIMSEWLTIPDHARQITKAMMRKPTLDRFLIQRESDIQNFVNFISKDSIQKSLEMYMEMLRQRKS